MKHYEAIDALHIRPAEPASESYLKQDVTYFLQRVSPTAGHLVLCLDGIYGF
jgi:hypothetical protein